MANYEIAPSVLEEFVPKEIDLDFHNGKCYASLVAFMFLDTRVLGFPVPFHVNFEEVNLRFYVKREISGETRRGVVFVKEIVPRRAISLVARSFYGEPYETWRMSHSKTENKLAYFWSKGNCKNHISVEIGENTGIPAENSQGEFIIEHYWGYTKRSAYRTDEYKVEHPKWKLFETRDAEIYIDFGFVYGEKFGFLSNTEPESILLAKGSKVAVYKGEKIN